MSIFIAALASAERALAQPMESSGEPSVRPVREWLDRIAGRAGLELVIASGAAKDRLDAPLLGCVAGEVDGNTLDALAFAGGLSMVVVDGVIHVDPANPDGSVWRLVSGAVAAPPEGRPEGLVRSAVELSDATVSFALGSCADALNAAIFVQPAVYETQPLVRLTGGEQTRLQLFSALASHCEATAVGFGDRAFALTASLPDASRFDQIDERVWMQRASRASDMARAASTVRVDLAAAPVEQHAASLAATIGANVRWAESALIPDRPSAAFRANGRFSDVADVWCGLRGLSWSLGAGANGVTWVLHAATSASANERGGSP